MASDRLAVLQMPHDVWLKLRVKMWRDARLEPRLGPFIIALGNLGHFMQAGNDGRVAMRHA